MEWSKIKNIILLILVLVNVALLALVVLRENRSAQNVEEARAGAVAALERSGIAVELERLPQDMELCELTFTRDRGGEQAAAEALLGAVSAGADSSAVRLVYTGAGGTAEFAMGGEFTVALEPGVHTLNGRTEEEAGLGCLELLGIQAELVSAVRDGGDTVLTYRQLWQGVPVFSCPVELTWRDGELVRIQGQRLAGSSAPAGGTELPLSTATVLVRFLAGLNAEGTICSRLEDMTAGYLLSGTTPLKMVPVWRITTDTGAYYVDGMTGTLSPTD